MAADYKIRIGPAVISYDVLWPSCKTSERCLSTT